MPKALPRDGLRVLRALADSERTVKAAVKKVLKAHSVQVFMLVPGGYGGQTLDFLCHAQGARTFYIEAKGKGKHPTMRQTATAARLLDQDVPVFLVDNPDAQLALVETALLDRGAQWGERWAAQTRSTWGAYTKRYGEQA